QISGRNAMTATAHNTAHRPAIAVTRNAIAAGHYLAATAGFDILPAGGTAIAAGVAAGIALGILQIDLVDFAGVAPIMIYHAEKREVVTIAGLGTWPKALDPELFMREHGGKIPLGVLRTVVPAAPDAWITALRRYGTMSFGEVAAAATRLARDGFPMYPLMAASLKKQEERLRSWPSTAAVLLPNGRAPEAGEVFRQTDLAAREAYYTDPALGEVPLPTLISSEYAVERRKLIDPHKAWPEMPPPGELGAAGQRLRASPPNPNPEPDTSYVCAADRWGNLFSATPSDGSYGSPMVPGTGLIPSSRGSQSRPDPRHPAGVAPGKRPRLTPNPALAIKGNGEQFFPF